MGAQAVRLSNIDIDNALENKDFEVLFQPIFDLGNGALARVETFIRWRHASLGVLPPGAFISFFESQGRMSELTRYVLGAALAQYREWRGANAPGFSINLALSDLADDAFAGHFSVLLRDSAFPADLITLECPMPPVTMAVPAAADYFQRLSQTGARLAIEVRGRANDFLRQIDPFPFDEIKTGGAAILRFARTVRGPGLSAISELLDIASRENAAITAVGVEDQASLAALRGLGFAAAQGNHLGKVGPLNAFTPSRVNEVRALLELEPLSQQDLHALFRTEAPSVQSAAPSATQSAAPSAPASAHAPGAATPAPNGEAEKDALVERLAARLARQSVESGAAENETAATTDIASAKAAAIARAKRKAAKKPAEPAAAQQPAHAAQPDKKSAAARHLQERLSREFDAMAEETGPSAKPAADDALDEIGDTVDSSVETLQSGKAPGAARDDAPPPDQDNAMTKIARSQSASPREAGPVPSTEEESARLSAKADTAEQSAALDVQAAPTDKTDKAFSDASLTVANARAFFRPGVRVGAGRPADPRQSDEAPMADSSAPDLPDDDDDVAFLGDDDDLQAAPAAEIAPDATPGPVPGPTSQSTAAAQAEDDGAEEAAPATEPRAGAQKNPRRKKNFLTRTVIPYPTHFWPKSWKRAYQRWDSARSARRAEQTAEAAE